MFFKDLVSDMSVRHLNEALEDSHPEVEVEVIKGARNWSQSPNGDVYTYLTVTRFFFTDDNSVLLDTAVHVKIEGDRVVAYL